MATQQPGSPEDQPSKGTRNKKDQNAYLVLGIVFLSLGIGLSFGGSSTWVPFLVIGITFLAVSGGLRVGRKRGGGRNSEDAP